ncbi:MAG: hypothetical protein ACJAYU_002598 [Bradymonadia bacterium]
MGTDDSNDTVLCDVETRYCRARCGIEQARPLCGAGAASPHAFSTRSCVDSRIVWPISRFRRPQNSESALRRATQAGVPARHGARRSSIENDPRRGNVFGQSTGLLAARLAPQRMASGAQPELSVTRNTGSAERSVLRMTLARVEDGANCSPVRCSASARTEPCSQPADSLGLAESLREPVRPCAASNTRPCGGARKCSAQNAASSSRGSPERGSIVPDPG